MKPIKLYLGDLTHETVTVSSDTMPLPAGFIASYVKKKLGNEIDVEVFKSPKEILERLKEEIPHVLGLSNYCWNLELSYLLFQQVKKSYPQTLTVMGGPNFPKESDQQYEFLKSRSAIDYYVFEEGEIAFAGLIQKYIDSSLEISKMQNNLVQGCMNLSPKDKAFMNGGILPRLKSLDEIPSPYLTGLLDKFFNTKFNPFIQTNRGCPFMCTFCHEGDADYFSSVNFFSIERVIEELNYIQSHIQGHTVMTIADSNFAMFRRDLEICRKIREMQDKTNFPRFINVTTGKNKPEQILESIKLLIPGSINFSSSVQSLDENVLVNIKRKNIQWDAYIKIQKTLHEIDPNYISNSELIIPLPGESKESHFETIKKLIHADVDRILPYTLMMLPGTELSTEKVRHEHQYVTKFRVIPRSVGKYVGKKCFEVEEVGVAHKDMPFEDYLECRKMHLLLFLAYNNMVYKELLKYLNERSVDVFDWLLAVYQGIDHVPAELKRVFSDFLHETNKELWNSRNELFSFFENDGNFNAFYNGTLGGNLLQKYWVRGAILNFKDLNNYLFDVARRLLEKSSCHAENSEIKVELNNIKQYMILKQDKLFDLKNSVESEVCEFTYDIDSWFKDEKGRKLKNFKLEDNQLFAAYLPEKHLSLLKQLFHQYGSSEQALGKISTRLNLKKFHRVIRPLNQTSFPV